MRSLVLVLALFGLEALAFPREVFEMLEKENKEKRQVPSLEAARALSKARTNCGPLPCGIFNEKEQYVSTTGDHAFKSPSTDQIRGPCPGLNAAANHGYLSRSGILTIQDTIVGLGAAYGMSPDLAGFLAAYAIITDGDPVLGTWSIGGPPPSNPLTLGLLGQSQGISYSHNVYEGDSSIARPDAYLNNGDAYSLDVKRFKSAYDVGQKDGSDRYTLDKFAQNFAAKAEESEATNPYYFAAPFSTTLVSPAAYNFVINFMSNHSKEEPNGYLNGAMFKEFFAVSGNYPNFKWNPGQEKIPNNWYRRTSANQYNAVNVFQDLGVQFAAYPDSFRLGGNTNGVNTYAGVDLADLTGGAFRSADLFDLKGTNAACFYGQFVQAILPDFASVALQKITAITNLINNFIKPITGGLDCPILDKYDQTLFNKFPGYKYNPKAPCTIKGC